MNSKTKNYCRLAAAVLVLTAVTAALYLLAGRPMLRFVSDPAELRSWVDSHGAFGRLAFLGMVIFQVLVAVIPGEPFELAAGFAFGTWEGTGLCILGAAAGSMLTFLLVRTLGKRLAVLFFEESDLERLHFLKSGRRRDLLFLVLYILPGTPKDLLGYFAGLTDMRFPVWVLICSFGRIPSVITSTLCGDALGTRDYRLAVIVLAVTLLISGAGIAIYEWLCRKYKRKEENSDSQ